MKTNTSGPKLCPNAKLMTKRVNNIQLAHSTPQQMDHVKNWHKNSVPQSGGAWKGSLITDSRAMIAALVTMRKSQDTTMLLDFMSQYLVKTVNSPLGLLKCYIPWAAKHPSNLAQMTGEKPTGSFTRVTTTTQLWPCGTPFTSEWPCFICLVFHLEH